MPQETDRLKLPLPLGNENVTRESINRIFEKIDAGVASQADLDTLREAVSQMDIPDASLTQKGKVQLSSKMDGTSETVAATEKAVRDARVTAINVATTDAITNAKSYVDTKTWQKHKLTQDTGLSINISNTNANMLTKNGDYVGENISNAPRTGAGEWFYIRVSAMATGVWIKQEAINLFTNTYQMRTGSDAGGGVISWSQWTADVFQSGVDAKNGIVDAINAKGGSASTSDTWAQLATTINGIQRGYYKSLKVAISSNTMPTTGAYTVHITYAAGTKLISLATLGEAILNVYPYTGGSVIASLALLDDAERVWRVTNDVSAGQGVSVQRLHFGTAHIDLIAGTHVAYTKGSYSFPDGTGMSGNYGAVNYNKPPNFNAGGELRLVTYCVSGDVRGSSIYTGFQNLISSSV